MKIAYIAVFAAFFLSSGAEEKPLALASTPTNLAVIAAQPEVLPVAPVVDTPENNPEPQVVAPELPADVRAIVNSKAGIKMLTVLHRGHLVTLRQGDAVSLGENSLSIRVKDAAPITWESSDRKTFETLQGIVEWDEQAGKSPTPRLRPTARVSPMREISSARHDCRAFDGTDEIVTVICRIDSLAVGAVRAFGNKPQDGISTIETGDHRYYRMDLDATKDDFDAVVIGYSDGIRGHVIRAEVSKLPGETKASFSLLAATRAQPAPLRIRRIFHERIRPPHDFEPFL